MAEAARDEVHKDDCPADDFRTVENMAKPDWRQRAFRRTLEQHQAGIAQYSLTVSVPKSVREQWDNARNLWLYAWHVWRFYPVAEMHAYSTLEMALRIKLGHDAEDRRPGLWKLMKKAIENGMLRDEHIGHHRRLKAFREGQQQREEMIARELGWPISSATPETDPQRYCKGLAELFPKLRNDYAHGSETLNFTTGFTFSVCRDLIEQLFKASA